MKGFRGRVIAGRTPKTVIVEVEKISVHPIYEKRMKRHKRFAVHDEIGVSLGDIVRFVDSRPYSKTKKWKIIEVIKK